MDISIKEKNTIFKYRVNGVIIIENKILTVQIMDNNVYCCPGGHIKIGETGKIAVEREMKEELQKEVESEKPIAFFENFFTRKNSEEIHEISLYYLIKQNKNIEVKDYIRYEKEDGINKKLEFKWIELSEIEKFNFQPKELINQLKNKNFDFKFYSINNKKN